MKSMAGQFVGVLIVFQPKLSYIGTLLVLYHHRFLPSVLQPPFAEMCALCKYASCVFCCKL